MYEVKFDKRLNRWVVVDERTGKVLYKAPDKNHAYRECSKLRDAEEVDLALEQKMLRGIQSA